MADWQPIATAPRDGTWVLLYSYGLGRVPGFWCDIQDDGFGFQVGPWSDGEGPFDLRDDEQPTHWLPLPSPPREEPMTAQQKKDKG